MAAPKRNARKGGRKSEYNKGEADTYIMLLERGLSHQRARQYLGRADETIKRWAAANTEFAEAIARAEPKREAFHLENIDKAASAGDWRASAWALAVMVPDKYSVKHRVEASGELKVKREIGDMADEELSALIRDLRSDLSSRRKKSK